MQGSRLAITLKSLIQQHEEYRTNKSVIRRHEENLKKKTIAHEENQNTNMSEKRTKTTNMTHQQQRTSDFMSKLPPHLAMAIFCKLHIKSLIYCRRVSKVWRNLISDPCFATFHLKKIILMFQFSGCNHRKPNCRKLFGRDIYMVDEDAITKVNMDFHIPQWYIKIVGSCNSLLCLCDDGPCPSVRFYISNPMTGEWMPLPKIERDMHHISGFGFSSNTNQYKVIRIPSSERKVAEIYTVGTGTWRSIGYPPYLFYPSVHGIYLNGALHWIVLDDNRSTLICAFDIGNEQFLTIPLPHVPFSEQGRLIGWANLGVIEGCLCVCARGSTVAIWVMREYGVKESWTKELVINFPVVPWWDENERRWWGDGWFQLIRYSINENTLMLSGKTNTNMVSYNPGTGGLAKLNDHGTRSKIEVFHHIPSFLSLEDIVMGKN